MECAARLDVKNSPYVVNTFLSDVKKEGCTLVRTIIKCRSSLL